MSAPLSRPPSFLSPLPLLIALLVVAGLVHGPIAQLADYHAFADQSVVFGIPHAGDVLSNLGFALVAIWGLCRAPLRGGGAAGYRLFLISLLLTAFGSTYYHLAPDNARLVWDRIPIALACAGLLAGERGEALQRDSRTMAAWLALFAVGSVAWWSWTENQGHGDLRPYLLLQILPMLLIPIWQAQGRTPWRERLAFIAALLLYALAKGAELNDHAIAAIAAPLTGHTLKHLLASMAAAVIVATLITRRPGQRATAAVPVR